MKQILLLVFASCLFTHSSGQCLIDSSNFQSGVYPSTLPKGCAGSYYNQTLNIIFPIDTVLFGFTLAFDTFWVDGITGLPIGLSYTCLSNNCTKVANPPYLSRMCLQISGVPVAATAANNKIIVNYTYSVMVPFVGPQWIAVNDTAELVINSAMDTTVHLSVSPATLTVQDSSGSYRWFDCHNSLSFVTGQTNYAFVAPDFGSYAVEITHGTCVDTTHCFDLSALHVEETGQLSFAVYPNRVSEILHISIERMPSSSLLQIYNLQGALVHEQVISGKTDINAGFLAKGMYLLKLSSGSEKGYRRFMKE